MDFFGFNFDREYLVYGGPDYTRYDKPVERAVMQQKLEKHIGVIDPELLRLIIAWQPTAPSMGTFLTSIAAYPNKRKIRALKEALTAPDRYSEENFKRIGKILMGERKLLDPSYFSVGHRTPPFDECWAPVEDPIDPDAPMITSEEIDSEIKRRKFWRESWNNYISYIVDERNIRMLLKFMCDLPTTDLSRIRISPYLRLPSGEYLPPRAKVPDIKPRPSGPITPFFPEPVVPQPLPPVPPVIPRPEPQPVIPVPETPVTDDPTVPVSEDKGDKKDEKKAFPWWIVIVIGVVALFFFMRD